MGINTVDSFDIHTGIVALRRTLDATAKDNVVIEWTKNIIFAFGITIIGYGE